MELIRLGLNDAVEQRSNPMESPQTPLASAINTVFGWLTGSQPTAAGELVNEYTALQHITVYRCVRLLGESVGSLTLRLYQGEKDGRQESTTDPLWKILALKPNNEMSAKDLWTTVVGCLSLAGNSYLEIIRENSDTVSQLYPLQSLETTPVRLPSGMLGYKTRDYSTGGYRILNAADVLHFRLFSWDGIKGLSPIQQARQDIGLARAATKHGAMMFGNGSKPPGILTPVGNVKEQDLVNMRKAWELAQGGENKNRTAVLPSEWKYMQIGLSNEDAQYLQTRQMSRADIASLFGIPPHMVGDTTRLSNNNHENESLSFVVDTLAPYLVTIEQEICIKLLDADPKRFVRFDVSERLRGDFASTMAGFAVGKQWGIFNSNYCLEKLGENGIGPQGDIYWCPVNMTNAENLLKSDEDEPTPGPEGEQGTEPTTQGIRNMFAHYVRSFTAIYSDGLGRILTRSKRDADVLTQVFAPLLGSIQELIEQEARTQFRLAPDWHASDKALKDYIKGAVTRSPEWEQEKRLEITAAELHKAIRSLYFAVYREAGAAIAERGLSNEEDAA